MDGLKILRFLPYVIGFCGCTVSVLSYDWIFMWAGLGVAGVFAWGHTEYERHKIVPYMVKHRHRLPGDIWNEISSRIPAVEDINPEVFASARLHATLSWFCESRQHRLRAIEWYNEQLYAHVA